jgi:transcription elongation factor Elf1
MAKHWEKRLEDSFVCPSCGAKNTPAITVIHMDRRGNARCAHCGREAAAREFLPEIDPDR